MPYSIVKSGGGYKVSSDKGTHFSKKPQTKSRAKKQLAAIAIHTHGEHFQHGAQSGR